ncbi:AIP3-domain-containing protein [Microthyrium microscopicum]|uniref:AIP3-domain-containing protein n=1 Tax=Microthyrium microscopicum TaxID=703497 RepID=A0A6A6UM15_9PEZI|nr:AIP3-domain-containing protein [Microthyrium microscopicum]
MAPDAATEVASRGSSAASARSSISRRAPVNPQQQLSQIEKSVTHLLVATKQLLETLTQWSRGSATENEVSDVYVRLGYEFNIACRAFTAIGVDTGDLGNVPEMLRGILEDTLSQEASQASLDRFLPRIRDIIIGLLQGLKRKQARLRSRNTRDLDRSGSTASVNNAATEEPTLPLPARGSVRHGGSREGSLGEIPPRTSSRAEGRASPNGPEPPPPRIELFDGPRELSDSSLSSKTAQNLPVQSPPYPTDDSMPQPTPPPHASFPNPPVPPPKGGQDALLALQKGGELERRASRRFSTYQINKQLGGGSMSGIMIPPAQNGPAPNRGREVRESLNAVRQRGSQLYNRAKSERRLVGDDSPSRNVPNRISEESLSKGSDKNAEALAELEGGDQSPAISATLSGPLDTPASTAAGTPTVPARRISSKKRDSPNTSGQFIAEESPQPGKPLTLFLQFKQKVKKIVLDDGSNDLSIARLQLAFIDKFAWNTHGNGMDLPEIYIQDSVSGVRYELEDLNDIKNNCVLVLNYEPLDEVKRHIDDGIGGLRRVVEGIKTSVDNQQSTIQRINDRQTETQKEIATIASAPPTALRVTSSSSTSLAAPKFSGNQLTEIQILRRNLAVLRQSYSSFASDMAACMSEVRTKAKAVTSAAVTAALPNMDGESGRAYMKTTLYESVAKEQSAIVDRVDDVQDSIEDLRKDVVTRGVRPLPRQLEQVAKDLSNATSDLKKLEALVNNERPLWNKIWKQELQDVCDDRETLKEVEALFGDMKLDLEESEKTFRLVEEACKQQNAMAGNTPANGTARSSSGTARVPALAFNINPPDPDKAKHGLLVEVQGLTVDHESRLEAIQRAERARQKELESRKDNDELKKELGSFVKEDKLKKSGGVEEAERIRKAKDERIRKEYWERQNGIEPAAEADAAEQQAPEEEKVNGES